MAAITGSGQSNANFNISKPSVNLLSPLKIDINCSLLPPVEKYLLLPANITTL